MLGASECESAGHEVAASRRLLKQAREAMDCVVTVVDVLVREGAIHGPAALCGCASRCRDVVVAIDDASIPEPCKLSTEQLAEYRELYERAATLAVTVPRCRGCTDR